MIQVEEFIALTDPKLQLFTGDEEDVNAADERPQHKITNFTLVELYFPNLTLQNFPFLQGLW